MGTIIESPLVCLSWFW